MSPDRELLEAAARAAGLAHVQTYATAQQARELCNALLRAAEMLEGAA